MLKINSAEVIIDGKKYNVSEGEIIVLPADIIHALNQIILPTKKL